MIPNTTELITTFRPGQWVKIITGPGENDDIYGYIERVAISARLNIIYQCSWWAGKEKKEDWFAPSQLIENVKLEHIRIGFSLNPDLNIKDTTQRAN